MAETTPAPAAVPTANLTPGTLTKAPSSFPLVPVLLTGIIVFLLTERFMKPTSEPGPVAPLVAVDPHFVTLGKAAEPQVATTYAQAWLAFAQALDSGQPFSAAIKTLEDKWSAGRQTLMTPVQSELGKIIPAGTADNAITPAQRSAASAAARGFAQGLNKGKGFPYFMPLSFPQPAEPAVAPETFAATTPWPDRVKLVGRSLSLPEPTPAQVPPSKIDGPSMSDKPVATLPPPVEAPPARPEPVWHWRYFTADPRVEAWGYLDEAGTFIYTGTRWRAGQPAATFAPACVGGVCGR